MNIAKYYSENGRNSSVTNLVIAKRKIKSEFETEQKTAAFSEYLNLLNAISYPDKFGTNAEIKEGQAQGINDALKYRYNALTKLGNHLKNLPLSENVQLNDTDTYIKKGAQEAMDKFEQTIKGQRTASRTGAMMVKTYDRLIENFKKIQENILKGVDTSDFGKGTFEGAMELDKFQQALAEYQKNNLKGDVKELAQTSYYFKPSEIKNDETIRNIAKNLIYWEAYFTYNPNGDTQIGDVAEAMGHLVADIYKEGIDAALAKGEKEVLEQLSKSEIGSSRTNTNNTIEMTIDEDDIKKLINDNNFSSASKEFTFDGYTYKANFSYNTDSKRLIKADVSVSDDMKISVKNWNGMTFKDYKTGKSYYKDLGSTFIINAIQRSCGNGILEDYIYVIQDNQIKESDEGTIAVAEAHELARLSLLADIASGYSQRSFGGNANFLVINDRKRKEWIGINLYDLILNSINNKRTAGSLGSYILELQGYEDQTISNVAWSIMNRVMKNKKGESEQKVGQASLMYKAMVLQRLHQEKVRAALNDGSLNNS